MIEPLATLTARQAIAGSIAAIGAAIVAVGLLRIFVDHFRIGNRGEPRPMKQSGVPLHSRIVASGALRFALPLLLILIAGTILRLDDLTVKTLSHTEAIVPNIALPAEISWPPPRHSFYDTFWWHFHSEGHPESYYFLMWLWTEVFGTGLAALRLPSVLFGIGSIALTYMLASTTYNRCVGLVSAALLAFSGFHIYWSQFARMYSMGCFLALLSTVALAKLVRHSRNRGYWEIMYVASSWLAIYTQTFFWTVLAAQMLWVALQYRRLPDAGRLLSLQQLVVIVGTAALAHIIYLGDDVTLAGPSMAFAAQYVSFGFIFQPDEFSMPARSFPAAANILLFIFSMICIAVPRLGRIWEGINPAAFRMPKSDGGTRALPISRLLPVAVGSSAIVVAISILALRRQWLLAFVALLPLAALFIMRGCDRSRAWMERYAAVSPGRYLKLVDLPVALAFTPPFIIFMLSFWTSMLAPRAFLMFVPFLLMVLAVGVVVLSRRWWSAVIVWMLLGLIYTAGITHYQDYPNEPRNYSELGKEMADHVKQGDMIFVVPNDWVTTPIFYYLDSLHPTYVAENYAAALADRPQARVWLLSFESERWGPYRTTNQKMHEALTGFVPAKELRALRSRAVLYVTQNRSGDDTPLVRAGSTL